MEIEAPSIEKASFKRLSGTKSLRSALAAIKAGAIPMPERIMK